MTLEFDRHGRNVSDDGHDASDNNERAAASGGRARQACACVPVLLNMISGTAGGPGRRAGSARGAAAWGWCAVAPEGVWEARARRAAARGVAAGWSPFF